jgi:Plasma-membrane choline transporter
MDLMRCDPLCLQRFAAASAKRDRVVRPVQSLLALHIFGLLWTTQVIVSYGHTVIAYCVARDYWANLTAHGPKRIVLLGMLRVLRYHLGTLAFGGFILAIAQFFRRTLVFIHRRLQLFAHGSQLENCGLRCVGSCLRCVLGASS